MKVWVMIDKDGKPMYGDDDRMFIYKRKSLAQHDANQYGYKLLPAKLEVGKEP